MSVFILKMIACITMFIDHATAIFVPMESVWYLVGRGIGRLAFPIYCFLLVEGYYHTRSKKKYLLRLGIFAIVSEFFFDFAFWNVNHMRTFYDHQNVFFTLFIGLAVICIYDYLQKKYQGRPWIFTTLGVFTIVGGSALAILLRTDYTFIGIIIILVFYLFHYDRKRAMIAYLVTGGFLFGNLQLIALFDIPLLWLYNGKKGPSAKYVFYAFYPVHLAILGIIARLCA